MVTKEEFGQVIAEFEAFRDLVLEELSKMKNNMEELKENIEEVKSELKISSRKLP